MRVLPKSRWGRSLLVGALITVLAGVYASDAILFLKPEWLSRAAVKVVWKWMQWRHGICFYVSFDEPSPIAWTRDRLLRANGTYAVAGRFGNARRFSGRNESHVTTGMPWAQLGRTYTLSIWMRPERVDVNQYVWACSWRKSSTGFIFRNGALEFHVPNEGPAQVLKATVVPNGEFFHAAATVDADRGEAMLYINGNLRDRIPLEGLWHPSQNMEFSKMRWYTTALPFMGDLDEAVAWQRTLGEKEIAALAKAKSGILPARAPLAYGVYGMLNLLPPVIRQGLRMADDFNPMLGGGRTLIQGWPVVELHLSKKDLRHFTREHENSLRSGLCTRRGANTRGVFVQAEGQTIRCEMALDSIGSRYHPAKRASYRLELPAESPLFGETQLRLIAPERLENDFRWLVPSRNGTNGFCRLLVNGHAKGIYYFESLNGFGADLRPGDEEDSRIRERMNAAQWRTLFRQDIGMPFSAPLYLPPEEITKRALATARLLAGDVQHPWSLREWKWRIRSVVEQHAESGGLRAEALLGRNPSAMFVYTNLNLAAADLFGNVLVWQSSHPEIVDGSGQVTRPKTDMAVRVTLTAVLENAPPVAMDFRVMPEMLPVPVIFAYYPESLHKTHRTELSARVFRSDGRDFWLTGMRKNRAGIKYRGNTSFWTGPKKPVALEFDMPHFLLNDSPTRHLPLLNGYKDGTRMKNKLTYDLFRQFADAPDKLRYSPEVAWCELFLNGVYYGVFEMAERVDGDLLGFPADAPPEAAGELFGPILFGPAADVFIGQEIPSPWDLDASGDMHKLQYLIQEASADEFAGRIANFVDISNCIDFTLLLNFAGNHDGLTANHFLARKPGADEPWFFIPWDYDSTFHPRLHYLANPLVRRMLGELPGFHKQMAARWAELRRDGALNEQKILAMIAEMEAPLANVMEWEHVAFPDYYENDHARFVQELRDVIHARLTWLDERFGFVAERVE